MNLSTMRIIREYYLKYNALNENCGYVQLCKKELAAHTSNQFTRLAIELKNGKNAYNFSRDVTDELNRMAYSNSAFVKIEQAFDVLSSEAQSLYVRDEVPTVLTISPLEFQREYVGPNVPVLIQGAIKHWPAIGKWKLQYFRDTLGDKNVTIAVTPNGYADAIAERHYVNERQENKVKEYFVLPEEREMKMRSFIDILEKKISCPGIFYLQEQNSNLTEKFQELLPDIDAEISWVREAFAEKPDAVNLWIGDSLAVTSLHKDPYENMYCVVRGYKDFILFPPTDRPWIPYKTYPLGSYKEVNEGVFDIIPQGIQQSVPDIEEDLSDDIPDIRRHSNDLSDEIVKSIRSGRKKEDAVTFEGFLDYINTSDIDDEQKQRARNLVDAYVSQCRYRLRTKHLEQQAYNLEKIGQTEEEEEDTVQWICIDPLNPNFELFPKFRKAKPVHVRVKEGDALYLPSFWFHHVRQSHACIAVNYWYNMKFDIKYAYFKMLESLSMQ